MIDRALIVGSACLFLLTVMPGCASDTVACHSDVLDDASLPDGAVDASATDAADIPDTPDAVADDTVADDTVEEVADAVEPDTAATDATDATPDASGAFFALSFDDPEVTVTLTGFGDETASLVADPTDAGNTVARLDKPATSPTWAGTTFSTLAGDSIPRLPVSATRKTMTLRVYLPDAGVPVRVKIEDAHDPTHSVETQVIAGAASTWQTLTFDFGDEAPGTAALVVAYTFDRVSVFANFGVDGATAGAKTYYVDDLVFE